MSEEEKMRQRCSRIGGKQEDNVCMVDGFPVPNTKQDWDYCASVPVEVLDEQREGFVIRMIPEDAKKLFPPTIYDESIIEKLRERIRDKKALCPCWADWVRVESETGFPIAESCFVSHEGRHRIEASIREGVKSIPIVVIKKERGLKEVKGKIETI